ncbi:hypothetical protein [Mixta sp. Marseille-Q2659]|uniref:hypothetical protein n=1 Tax=Mixta sp. Marseille-Q2659 TaxID=2736607 RepID=UPI0023BA1900|nr:hypothetical protein [Mixta sp. Marseille-Q2659]
MNKSAMRFVVRSWKKELKKPEWLIGSRRRRNSCARDFAGASLETDIDIRCQQDADELVAEELTYWD